MHKERQKGKMIKERRDSSTSAAEVVERGAGIWGSVVQESGLPSVVAARASLVGPAQKQTVALPQNQ